MEAIISYLKDYGEEVEEFYASGGFLGSSELSECLGDPWSLTHWDCWPGREYFEADEGDEGLTDTEHALRIMHSHAETYAGVGCDCSDIVAVALALPLDEQEGAAADAVNAMMQRMAKHGAAVYIGVEYNEVWLLSEEGRVASLLWAQSNGVGVLDG